MHVISRYLSRSSVLFKSTFLTVCRFSSISVQLQHVDTKNRLKLRSTRFMSENNVFQTEILNRRRKLWDSFLSLILKTVKIKSKIIIITQFNGLFLNLN